jgi:hypothetical protein
LSIHASTDVQLCDIVGWSRLNPDTLPYAAAGRIEDVSWDESLFANWYNIVAAVSGIVHEDQPDKVSFGDKVGLIFSQFIRTVEGDEWRDVQGKREISSTIEASLLPIDKDGCLIVHSTKVQQHVLVFPSLGYRESCGQPGIKSVVPLDSCTVVNSLLIQSKGMTLLPDRALSKQDGIRTSLVRACPNGGAWTASSPGAF